MTMKLTFYVFKKLQVLGVVITQIFVSTISMAFILKYVYFLIGITVFWQASSVDPSKYLKCQQKICDLVLELKLNVDGNTKVKMLIQGQKTKEYKQENIAKVHVSSNDWEKDRLKW